MFLHPDDVLNFNQVSADMWRVAKDYGLNLRSISPTVNPDFATSALGTCNASGDIHLTMRGKTKGVWAPEPRNLEDVYRTAGHELAHLKHLNHGLAFQAFEQELIQAMRNKKVDQKDVILDKLVKLQRQAESEAKIGNSAAAEAFAQQINRLLLKYELEPTDIDYARTADPEPVVEIRLDLKRYQIKEKKTRIAWQEALARVIARNHLCQFYIRTGSNVIWFVGTKSHATVAEYVFGTLVNVVPKLANNEYYRFRRNARKENADRARGKRYETPESYGFVGAWLDGFVERIDERLKETRAEVLRTETSNPEGALIRLSGALKKVQDYTDAKFAKKRRYVAALEPGTKAHSVGRQWGREAADRMTLGRRGVTGGTTSGPKMLGAGK